MCVSPKPVCFSSKAPSADVLLEHRAEAGGLCALRGWLRGRTEGCCCRHPWHSPGLTPELGAVHRALQGVLSRNSHFPALCSPSRLWGACPARGPVSPAGCEEPGRGADPSLQLPGVLQGWAATAAAGLRAGASLLACGRAGSCSALALWSVLEARTAHLAICEILLQANKSFSNT